jgi:hypothetical protein
MASLKISKQQTELIDLGTKKFFKYNSPTSEFEVKKTVLNGRSPDDPSKAYIESESFAIYVLKGEGTILLGDFVDVLAPEDVVYVLK